MTKWIKRIGIALIVLVIGLSIITYWAFREAFGPKYRTVQIQIDEKRTLIGKETYNSDLAALFYDVNFTLVTKNLGEYKLGSGSFSDEHWEKDIKLFDILGWTVLPVKDGSYSKILLTNKVTKTNKDTIFSPQNLLYDSLWKQKYNDIPTWVYSGSSKLDSIIGDRFFITYEYRIGEHEPFKYYRSTIEYYLDNMTGKLKTINIFERHEKNYGS